MIRSIKRYLTNKFNEQTGYKDLSNDDKARKYFDLLDSFIDSLYSESFKTSGLPYSKLYDYVRVIINLEIMKRPFNHTETRKFNKLFYEIVYKYSHGKLSKLFRDKVFKFLFVEYEKSGDLIEMINTDSTLVKNKDHYLTTMKYFMHSFEVGKYTMIKAKKGVAAK